MKKFFHYLAKMCFFTVFLTTASIFLPKLVNASEGTIELRSTNNQPYRCFAASIQGQNLVYTILVTCRDLIYPAGDNIFSYVLWATPADGKKPINLGSLGLGRVTASTKADFIGLFVTTEAKAKTGTPTGPTVMSGSVKRVSFLDNPSEKSTYIEPSRNNEQKLSPVPTESVANQSSTNRLITGLKRAGLAFVLALVTAIVIIFFVTKSKK